MAKGHGGKRDNAGRKSKQVPKSHNLRLLFGRSTIPTETTATTNMNAATVPTTTNNTTVVAAANTAPTTTTTNNTTPATSSTTRDDRERDAWRDIPLSILEKREKGRKVSGLLKEQYDELTTDAMKERGKEHVRAGEHWQKVGFIGHKDIADLGYSWKAFQRLSIFHWFPLERLDAGNWRPLCPNCGSRCVKNGTAHPPRLIYGVHHNYILHSPQRLLCKRCAGVASVQAGDGVPKEERAQQTWLCHDTAIMEQITEKDPNLAAEFPCILSHINGIDLELHSLMEMLATKGVGPMALAEMIISFHEATWQQNELRWLSHLYHRFNNPLITDIGLKREDISKCPGYLSEELGGATPSDSYLMTMFCRGVERKKMYYDADVLWRLRDSKVLSWDAHYKLGKRMKYAGQDKHYDTLHNGLNEYGEYIARKWSNGDSHEEMMSYLQVLKSHGFAPSIVFTDDPDRDRRIFMEVFPTLREGVDEEAFSSASNDAAACGLNILPVRGQHNYIYRGANANAALSMLMEKLDEADVKDKIVSLDGEWPVDVIEGMRSPGKFNLLLLTSPVIQETLIIELYSISGRELQEFGRHLQRLFTKPSVVFVGCCHKADLTRLRNDYPQLLLPVIDNKRIIDVREIAISRGIAKRGIGQTTLAALCQKAGHYLPKDSGVRVSNLFGSKNGSLRHREDALGYCHRDAEAPLFLYNLWRDMPILTERLSTSADIKCGMCVEIMPASGEHTEPIAVGFIVKIEGTTASGVSLEKGQSKRCAIRVVEVFNENGIIHIPRSQDGRRKCKCNRFQHGEIKLGSCDFFRMKQFGEPPFQIVETVCRLRNATRDFQDTPMETSDGEVQASEGVAKATNDTNSHDDEEGAGGVTELLGINDNLEGSADFVADEDVLRHEIHDLESTEHISFQATSEQLSSLDRAIEETLPQGETNNEDEGYASIHDNVEEGIESPEHFLTPIQKLISDAEIFWRERYGKSLFDSDPEQQEDDDIIDEVFKVLTRVLGDAFHVMDRVKVPMHHDFKIAYFRALRAAIFLFNPEDVANVKRSLKIETDPKAWDRLLAFHFKFIAERVRRRIPDPDMLFERVQHVFNTFQDTKDAKTGKPLFNEAAKHKSKLVLKLIKSGLLSDPPGYSFYAKKMNSNGLPMKDKYGLQLYRSIRGTSLLESLHQFLTRSFGHTRSAPFYSDSLLTLVTHGYNWRTSIRNRPGFVKLRHYDGLAIDRVNEFYEKCFGKVKYPNWRSTNDSLPHNLLPGTSLFGIVKMPGTTGNTTMVKNSVVQVAKIKNSDDYLSLRQGTDIPFKPVEGKIENELFVTFIKQAINSSTSLSSFQTFVDIADEWSRQARGKDNSIYMKRAIHIARRYKRYRDNLSKREAFNTTEAQQTINALEHAPTDVSMDHAEDLFSLGDQYQPLQEQIEDILPAIQVTAQAPVVRKYQCKHPNCTLPTCSGGRFGICQQHEPHKKRKVKVKYSRKDFACKVCDKKGCKGVSSRKRCPNFARTPCKVCQRNGCEGLVKFNSCPKFNDTPCKECKMKKCKGVGQRKECPQYKKNAK